MEQDHQAAPVRPGLEGKVHMGHGAAVGSQLDGRAHAVSRTDVRVLIGGVGYRNLRDHSFGVVVTDALAERAWPGHVSVEDISYNPIALVQRLEDDTPDRRFSLAIVVAGVPRPGRAPGTVAAYRWDSSLPGPEGIQAAVAEAVTGVIALDNTLVIGRHFGALPPTVVVIEVEPAVHEFGDALSPEVASAFTRVCEAATELALNPASAIRVPAAPLGAF